MVLQKLNWMKGVKFETFAYHIDYMVNGKYIGSITTQEKDRETCGYHGRQTSSLIEDITVKKNGGKEFTIKARTQVTTELFPLNGRRIK